MAQASFARASALGNLPGFRSTESPQCSASHGSSLHSTIEFSKSTRLKSNSKQPWIDSESCCGAQNKPFSGQLLQAQFSQRYQTAWDGKDRENSPDFGRFNRLGLYSSRRVAENPTFGARIVNSLNQKAPKTEKVRGPVPPRFSNGTQSFGGCSPVDEDEFTLSLTSFNILAPIYYRKWEGKRESEEREAWWERNKKIVDMLEEKHSSIICLQVGAICVYSLCGTICAAESSADSAILLNLIVVYATVYTCNQHLFQAQTNLMKRSVHELQYAGSDAHSS